MENRKRNVHLHVMVTPDELAAIHERMAEAGISNAGAYVRKMALNGYILHIDLAPVKELISLQRRCSNTVSYTHLDVYKRQAGERYEQENQSSKTLKRYEWQAHHKQACVWPVSYTHLGMAAMLLFEALSYVHLRSKVKTAVRLSSNVSEHITFQPANDLFGDQFFDLDFYCRIFADIGPDENR